ncbi:Short-chain dehydrogenase/reductase SDR [Alkalibacterium sp. AK22]|uniref:SDR family NAD(P)-dependent oxidoreductase n=1 Tax=Alkalibacterium sp. AK22 TaxID=1229520 RepID=UPI0004474FB1|nr:SDR family oxidoreductase [Alkalibacterium sp. AK22]EXJ24156.1 Short-chain dehydrogenase/reductase SDR [Alkalibacterium sp. AK22]
MDKVQGKVIWITGASSGIGEELAYQLAEKGATLILSARSANKLKKVKEECVTRFSAQVLVYPMDVSDPEAIKAAVSTVSEKIGSIDVLINNAGFGHTQAFLDYDFSRAENMFKVNVLGLMYMSQLVARDMKQAGAGHIINIASIAGKVATPKSAVYSATKFAVIGFSNALRLELKDNNIQVTTVNPGPVDTPFFDEFDPSGEYLKNVSSMVLSAEYVAHETVAAIGTKKREVNLPRSLSVASKLYALFPLISDFLVRTAFNKK